jgi:hypothetical protein
VTRTSVVINCIIHHSSSHSLHSRSIVVVVDDCQEGTPCHGFDNYRHLIISVHWSAVSYLFALETLPCVWRNKCDGSSLFEMDQSVGSHL